MELGKAGMGEECCTLGKGNWFLWVTVGISVMARTL